MAGQIGNGTGVLVNNEYIITVKHLVAPHNDFTITFNDGSTAKAELYALPAGVALDDMELGEIAVDLAILKLKAPYQGKVTTKMQCSVPPIGDEVYTIGQPNGFPRMITYGHISINTAPENDKWYVINLAGFMGNSGGGLFDRDTGLFIGITSAVAFWPSPQGDEQYVGVPAPISFIVQPKVVCDFLWQSKVPFVQIATDK